MRLVLPEGSACRILCHVAVEEDVTSFLLTHVTGGMTFIDGGAKIGDISFPAGTTVP